MFEKLIPREKEFFSLFERGALKCVEACKAFEIMLDDLEHSESHTLRIKSFEHEADEITHNAVERVYATFVTPFDREDIHRLVTRLDDILDRVDSAAERIFLYDLVEPTPEVRDLARVLTRAAEHVAEAVSGLKDAGKKPQEVLERCIEVNRLENEGDAVYRRALASLFRDQTDLRLVMKWREVYEILENAIDRCEDVAGVVQGIVIQIA